MALMAALGCRDTVALHNVRQSRHRDVGIGVPVLQTPTTICYVFGRLRSSSGRAPRIAAESAAIQCNRAVRKKTGRING